MACTGKAKGFRLFYALIYLNGQTWVTYGAAGSAVAIPLVLYRPLLPYVILC